MPAPEVDHQFAVHHHGHGLPELLPVGEVGGQGLGHGLEVRMTVARDVGHAQPLPRPEYGAGGTRRVVRTGALEEVR